MANAGQHLGALRDLTQNPLAHHQKCVGCLANFPRARGFQVDIRMALAEPVGGGGQPPNRPNLLTQEIGGDQGKHQGGADHPEYEDVGG